MKRHGTISGRMVGKSNLREVVRVREGDYVRLKKFKEFPEQDGLVLEDPKNGCVAVELDRRFRSQTGTYDDGIREVPLEQVKEVLRHA